VIYHRLRPPTNQNRISSSSLTGINTLTALPVTHPTTTFQPYLLHTIFARLFLDRSGSMTLHVLQICRDGILPMQTTADHEQQIQHVPVDKIWRQITIIPQCWRKMLHSTGWKL